MRNCAALAYNRVDMFTWEEELTSDVCELWRDGIKLGEVKPIGGSWGVIAIIEGQTHTVALRPDKQTAQSALINFLTAAKAE